VFGKSRVVALDAPDRISDPPLHVDARSILATRFFVEDSTRVASIDRFGWGLPSMAQVQHVKLAPGLPDESSEQAHPTHVFEVKLDAPIANDPRVADLTHREAVRVGWGRAVLLRGALEPHVQRISFCLQGSHP
jgi:hypothetical protein